MPESNDPSHRSEEGAVKLKNDNDIRKNLKSTGWRRFFERGAGGGWTKACKDVHFRTIERGKWGTIGIEERNIRGVWEREQDRWCGKPGGYTD